MRTSINFEAGASFDTLVYNTLGPTWNVANGILFAFLLYILDYAYISGGGAIVSLSLEPWLGQSLPQYAGSLLFAVPLAVIVWVSTLFVSRVLIVLIIGIVITFVLAMSNLVAGVDIALLFSPPAKESETPYFYYIFAALPFFLTSFGFQSSVPSLMSFYDKNVERVQSSILIAGVICVLVYLVFLIVSFGNVPRLDFGEISAQGGNIDLLVGAMNANNSTNGTLQILNWFANCALVSSFLGVSLGLFDFIRDKFGFADTPKGRFFTALISFLPPIVGGTFFPDGFIFAIGFAGLTLAILALIIPPLMLKKSKILFPGMDCGIVGKPLIGKLVLSFGLVCVVCHTLSLLDLLPVY